MIVSNGACPYLLSLLTARKMIHGRFLKRTVTGEVHIKSAEKQVLVRKQIVG